MNTIEKIRNFCSPFRIVIGLMAIIIGYLLSDGTLSWSWWYLGVIPLIAGLSNFCPLCMITKKCDIGSKR
ncbi:hypothetical protein ALC152_06930 [Arcobacter sp. 15-2]|uniref:YgaP family membrane protein n=1 Tax=Arcobacter sp. 15-2 TaxID=3374109 RepID=UPI00399D2DA7